MVKELVIAATPVKENIYWRVLIVDDDKEVLDHLFEYYDNEPISSEGDFLEVTTLGVFEEAMDEIERNRFDLIILDIRDEAHSTDAGFKVLELIKSKQFIPVIFYSGIAHLAKEFESMAVKVVKKDVGFINLTEAIQELLFSGLPSINREMEDHLQMVQRKFMWKYAKEYWNTYNKIPDKYELAYLLARRLALSFANFDVNFLADTITAHSVVEDSESVYEKFTKHEVSPLHYYIVPPLVDNPLTGDLYKGQIGDRNGYWLVLTPSCDFWNSKGTENVLLAECNLLTSSSEFEKWAKKPDDATIKDNFKKFLGNRKTNRTFFLPQFLDNPNLIVDFQKLSCPLIEEFMNLERIASLDSTYASEVISKFILYYARIGTPDLNTDPILEQLHPSRTAQKVAATKAPALVVEEPLLTAVIDSSVLVIKDPNVNAK